MFSQKRGQNFDENCYYTILLKFYKKNNNTKTVAVRYSIEFECYSRVCMFLNECNKCSFRVESGLFEFATT